MEVAQTELPIRSFMEASAHCSEPSPAQKARALMDRLVSEEVTRMQNLVEFHRPVLEMVADLANFYRNQPSKLLSELDRIPIIISTSREPISIQGLRTRLLGL